MEYRIATASDCVELTRLRMKMRGELDADFREEDLYLPTLNFFRRNIGSGQHAAFVCEDEGRIVATAGMTFFEMMPTSAHINGRAARLMNMYVEPEYRRKGIASRLLGFAMRYAKDHSVSKVMLNPSRMGEELYKKYGFERAGNEFEFYIN